MWRRVQASFQWLRFRWSITITLLLAVAIAVGLAAVGPALIDNLLTYALRRSLLNTSLPERNISLTTVLEQDLQGYKETNGRIQNAAATYFPKHTPQIVSIGTLPTALPWKDGQLLSEQRIDIQFYGQDPAELQQQVLFIAGGWPDGSNTRTEVIPAVIGESMAEAFNLSIGDQLPLSNRISAIEPNLWLEVSGIIRPLNSQAPFWYGEQSPLRTRFDNRFLRHSALIRSSDQLFTSAQQAFPNQSLTFSWLILFNPHLFTQADLETMPASLSTFENELLTFPTTIRTATQLTTLLNDYTNQAEELRTPLSFMTFTVTLLAFMFLGMAAQLAAEQQQGEWRLMQERGFTHWQLLKQQAGRNLLICIIALFTGWVIAYLLMLGLNRFGPLADIRDRSWGINWPVSVWSVGLVTAIVSFILLLWPFTRQNKETQTDTTRSKKPIWHRLYIDGILLCVGLILLIRFWLIGGLIAANNNKGVDWLQILAPVLTLIGAIFLLLRLLPFLLQLISHWVGRNSSLAPFLAITYAARSQGQALRLILLFALTVTLGIFTSSTDAALSHNEANRAVYATGGEARLIGSEASSAEIAARHTAVWRGRGSFELLLSNNLPTYEILAIDPKAFFTVASLQESFAQEPIQPILDTLPHAQLWSESGLALPEDTEKLGIWFQLPTDNPEAWQGISLEIKIAAQSGDLSLVQLRQTETGENNWRYYEAALPTGINANSLHSIWVRSRTYAPEFRAHLSLDELVAIDQTGEATILAHFDEGVIEWATNDFSHGIIAGDVSPYLGDGKLSLIINRSSYNPQTWYGVLPITEATDNLFYMSGLVSRRFAEETAVQPGDELEVRLRLSVTDVVPALFQVVGIVDHFPTLYDESDPFMVVSRDQVLALINYRRHQIAQPTEYLFTTNGIDASLKEQAAQVITAAEIEQTLRAYPLAVGLRSASQLGYLLATIISLGGFAAHLIFVLRQRQNQFAVLHALGLNGNQLYLLLAIEQALLIFAGLLVGSGFGLLLSWFILNNLNFDWGGLAAAPPFVVVWDWMALAQIYLYFGLTLFFALGLVVWISRRIRLQQALRVMLE